MLLLNIGGANFFLWIGENFPFKSFEGQNESFLFVLCFVIYVLITFHFNYTKLGQNFFITIIAVHNEGLRHEIENVRNNHENSFSFIQFISFANSELKYEFYGNHATYNRGNR